MEMNGLTGLVVEHIFKQFDNLPVLGDLSLEVKENRMACILGPSGCGKTTLLNIIAGVISPDSGSITGCQDKKVSYLFQETRLLKWKTVRQNIEFVLKDHLPVAERRETVNRYMEMVGLSDFADYYPAKLSGGMKQRVAIARAFAYPANLLLMDEPFNGLDLAMKMSFIKAFTDLWLKDRRTALFVTHTIQEALLLGDEIFVLSNRPAHVKHHITVDIPHQERTLEHPQIIQLENTLYNIITTA